MWIYYTCDRSTYDVELMTIIYQPSYKPRNNLDAVRMVAMYIEWNIRFAPLTAFTLLLVYTKSFDIMSVYKPWVGYFQSICSVCHCSRGCLMLTGICIIVISLPGYLQALTTLILDLLSPPCQAERNTLFSVLSVVKCLISPTSIPSAQCTLLAAVIRWCTEGRGKSRKTH